MNQNFYKKEYKGKIIYITDWSNIREEEALISKVWETTEILKSLNEKDLLEIINLKNSIVTKNVLINMQKAAKVSRPYNKKKAVVSDFNNTRMFILKTINRVSQDKIEPFSTEEDALEWLIKEEKSEK